MRLLRITAILVLLLAGCGKATTVKPSATPTLSPTSTLTVASTPTPGPTLPPPTETAAPPPTPTPAVPEIVKVAEYGKGGLSPVFRSPDGKRVIVGGIDRKVRWYDTETGQEQGVIEADMYNLTYSPDGSLAALETLDGILLVNLDTGKVQSDLGISIYEVQSSPVFSPDMRYVVFLASYRASRSIVEKIKIIRFEEDREIKELPLLPRELVSFSMSPPALSPDSAMIAAGGSDHRIYIWDAETEEIHHALEGHSAAILSVAFRDDGKQIASLDLDRTIHVWDLFEGKLLQTFEWVGDDYSWLNFGDDGTIRLGMWQQPAAVSLNPATGAITPLPREPAPTPDPFEVDLHQQGYLTEEYGAENIVAFSPDGSEIAVSGRNILLWDRETQKLNASLELAHSALSMVYSPDGKRLAVSIEYEGTQVLDTSSGEVIFSRLSENPSKFFSAFDPAFSPDGTQLAFGIENSIEIWDLGSGELHHTLRLQGEDQHATQVAYSEDGSRLYNIVNHNHSGQVWDLGSGKLLSQTGQAEYHTGVFIASDLRPPYFARNNSNGTEAWIDLYNLDNGQVLKLPAADSMNDPLVISPDGGMLFAWEYMNNILSIFDTATGKLIHDQYFPQMGGLAAQPDLGLLAAEYDGVVRIYNMANAHNAAFAVETILPIADLSGFSGEWSPASNQMAGIGWNDSRKGSLTVASAPGFAPTALMPEAVYAETNFGHKVTWKPDGSQIVFSGPAGLDEIGEASALWTVEPSGEGARRFLENATPLIWMKIPGWLDANTMILESHMGGITWLTRLVDSNTGKVLAQENIPGEVFPGRPTGAPFEYHVSGSRIGVLTPIQPGERLGPDSKNVRMMPEYDRMLPPEVRGMDVLGWRPGSEKLLVSVETLRESGLSVEAAQVLEWDLATDQVELLAPRTSHAEYSPDGRWLALSAYDRLTLNPDQTINRDMTPDAVDEERSLLYLVDTVDGKVKLHLPVAYHYQCCKGPIATRILRAAFSPNSRYLAFVTMGSVQVDASGILNGVDPSGGLMLNVLDLHSLQIALSVPFANESRFEPAMLWSPTGEKLFYTANRVGPVLLDATSGEITKLGVDTEMSVQAAAWSHDGTFISLLVHTVAWNQESDTHTLIFEVQ